MFQICDVRVRVECRVALRERMSTYLRKRRLEAISEVPIENLIRVDRNQVSSCSILGGQLHFLLRTFQLSQLSSVPGDLCHRRYLDLVSLLLLRLLPDGSDKQHCCI